MTESNLKPLQTIIPVLTGLHIYLSFRWLYKYLEIQNLEFSNVITFEDLLFHFGDLNQSLLLMALQGCSIVFVAKFAFSEHTFANLNTIAINGIKEAIKTNFEAYKTIKKTWKKITVIILINIALILFFYFAIYQSFKEVANLDVKSWIFLYLLMSIVAPISYVFYVQKRGLILVCSVIIFIFFANKLIDKSITEASSNQPETFIAMSFSYKENQLIKTNKDTLWSYFDGYKYFILQNPKSEEVFLYEPELVTNIRRKVVPFKTNSKQK